MSWFKVDDKSAFHKKVVDAGNEAWGACCRAGAWSADHLTDGKVPWSVALTIAPGRIWQRLFKVRLCEPVDDSELQIHDYLEWNPSAEEVQQLRAQRSEAGRSGGRKSGSKRQAKAKQVLEQPLSKGSSKAEAKSNPVPVPVPNREAEAPALPPDGIRLLERIRAHSVFDRLPHVRIVEHHLGFMMAKGQRLEWALAAIDECAAKMPDGMLAEARQAKLVGFLRHAKAPKDSPAPPLEPSKVIESDEDTPEKRRALWEAAKKDDAETEAKRKRRAELEANPPTVVYPFGKVKA